MICTLGNLDPFNFDPFVGPQQVSQFTKHLTGNEFFEFADGDVVPKSMILFNISCNFPQKCSALGWLLSVDYDEFCEIGANKKYADIEDLMNNLTIGAIGIEYGGELQQPKITSTKMPMNWDLMGKYVNLGQVAR